MRNEKSDKRVSAACPDNIAETLKNYIWNRAVLGWPFSHVGSIYVCMYI